jgi:hypothetical protein
MATTIQVKGIISFPHLFEPRAVNEGDDPKYSVNCLIRKDDPQVQTIQNAIETEKQNTFPNGFPPNGKLCLKDGDVEPNGVKGYYELRANTGADNPPHVVHVPGAKPVTDRSKVYPGAVAWCIININGYNKQINKGVGAYINGVGITGEEGELGRLDNKPSAEQMFAGVGGDTAPQQVAPAAPAAPATPPPAPTSATYQMTDKANGLTRDQYHQAGWTDELLIQHGMMLPPGGVAPSFG